MKHFKLITNKRYIIALYSIVCITLSIMGCRDFLNPVSGKVSPGDGIHGDFLYAAIGYNELAIVLYTGNINDVEIPTRIRGNKVTMIGNAAFKDSKLTGVIIPGHVKKIGIKAFSGNELTSLVLPVSLEIIEEEGFMNNRLSSIIFENRVTTIGVRAFENNNLVSITIPESVMFIRTDAFAGNQLYRVSIGDNVNLGANSGGFGGNFSQVYNGEGGTFTRTSLGWVREE